MLDFRAAFPGETLFAEFEKIKYNFELVLTEWNKSGESDKVLMPLAETNYIGFV